jgi:uncharacterized phage-associated protein
MKNELLKLNNVVKYIIKVCSNKDLGAIKLNKILWFSDMLYFKSYNKTMTQGKYVKRQYGPVPFHILQSIQYLERNNIIESREERYNGYTQRKFFYKKESEPIDLLEEEKLILNDVIHQICDKFTATQISEMTHDDIWKLANLGEEIPMYATLASILLPPDDKDVQWIERVLN